MTPDEQWAREKAAKFCKHVLLSEPDPDLPWVIRSRTFEEIANALAAMFLEARAEEADDSAWLPELIRDRRTAELRTLAAAIRLDE